MPEAAVQPGNTVFRVRGDRLYNVIVRVVGIAEKVAVADKHRRFGVAHGDPAAGIRAGPLRLPALVVGQGEHQIGPADRGQTVVVDDAPLMSDDGIDVFLNIAALDADIVVLVASSSSSPSSSLGLP